MLNVTINNHYYLINNIIGFLGRRRDSRLLFERSRISTRGGPGPCYTWAPTVTISRNPLLDLISSLEIYNLVCVEIEGLCVMCS